MGRTHGFHHPPALWAAGLLVLLIIMESDFLSRISMNRAISIADFYFENKKYKQAIEIFKLLSEKHPESNIPLKRLEEAYKAQNVDRP